MGKQIKSNIRYLLKGEEIQGNYGLIKDYDNGDIIFIIHPPHSLEEKIKNSIEVTRLQGKSESDCRIYILDYYKNTKDTFFKHLFGGVR